MAYVNQNGQVRVGVRGWVPVFGPEDPGTPNTIDQDSINFILASGISDSVQTSAIETLVSDLKTYGLWTKMKAIYPFVGGSAASHKFNLKDPRDLDAAYRLVFNGGWIHSSNGAKPNGTTGWATTYFNPVTQLTSQTSNHISTYLRTNIDEPAVDMGSYADPGVGYDIESRIGNISYNFNGVQHTPLSFANTDSRGFYVNTRQSSILHKVFVSNVLKGSNTSTFNVLPNTNVALAARFNVSSGTSYSFSTKEQAFASIGDGLTDTEAANFNTAVQKFQTTLGRHVGTPYVSDPDAISFLIAAGITDGTQAAAINTLVIRMKADGVWTKMKAIYPFVGGTAASHKFNLKDPRDLDAAYRLVFTGGWTHTGTGAKPNASNTYADTKLIPNSALTLNSTHLSFYSRTDSAIGGADFGVSLTNPAMNMFTKWTDNNAYHDHYSSGADRLTISMSGISTSAFFISTRTTNTSLKVYRNGDQIGVTSVNQNVNSLPTSSIWISAHNSNGSYSRPSNRETSFASIGDGLTDGDASNLYSTVQTYQTTLGRQVNVPLVSDTDAQSFLNAANITSFQQASAVNKLVVDLKAAGVWSKMKTIYPFVGGSAASHKFNLKDPRDLDAAYRLVFNGGWVHSSTGALPNGSNAYADTKLIPLSHLLEANHHYTYYSRSNDTPLNEVEIGTANTFGYYSAHMRVRLNGYYGVTNKFTIGLNSSNTYVDTSYTNTDSRGFYQGQITSTSSRKLYKNGVNVANVTQNSPVDRSPWKVYIGALSEENIAKFFSIKETAFASIGDGMTDTEASAFYTAVQTYQTSLGRAVDTPVYNNGLVLNLDAGNANSYPGTGTTWFDLASGNNGTLFSGITYDVNNGGGLIFNGSNQYISSFNNTNLNFTSSDKFTISCFFKATSTSSFLGLVVSGNTSGEWNYGIWVTDGKIQVGTHNNNRVGNSTIVIGQIYQATLTYSNNTMKVYLNGINDGTFTSFSLFNGLNQQLVIGRKGANAANYFPGTVYNVQIYNRELSATEILNNFNSSRGRFGL